MLAVKSVVPASSGPHFQSIIESEFSALFFQASCNVGPIPYLPSVTDSPSNPVPDLLNAFSATGEFDFYTKQVIIVRF